MFSFLFYFLVNMDVTDDFMGNFNIVFRILNLPALTWLDHLVHRCLVVGPNCSHLRLPSVLQRSSLAQCVCSGLHLQVCAAFLFLPLLFGPSFCQNLLLGPVSTSLVALLWLQSITDP